MDKACGRSSLGPLAVFLLRRRTTGDLEGDDAAAAMQQGRECYLFSESAPVRLQANGCERRWRPYRTRLGRFLHM